MKATFSDQLLRELGAWEYGLRIVTDVVIPSVERTGTPKRFCFELAQTPTEIVEQIRSSGSNWAIKYSCCGSNDFSHYVKRGDNSSLGRTIYLDRQIHEFVIQRIDRLIYHAPQHTAKILFQELVDQSTGYLFHADLAEHRLELEVLFNSHRVLALSDYVSDPLFETSSEDQLPEGEMKLIYGILWKLQECKNVLSNEFFCESWGIEGFWEVSGPKLLFLQLRPTPLDRPKSKSKLDPTIRLKEAVFDTGFVWGLCNKEVEILNGEVEASAALSLCKSDRVVYDSEALSGFESGALDLVIRSDSRSASRLSHEPWFLPPPEHRNAFCHVWIRSDVIARFDGRRLQLVSDGNRARLLDK